jgi:uncharacterized protein (UPF0332 family)
MDLQSCFENSLLLKTTPDVQKAKNSIKTSEHKLELAKKEADADIFEGAMVSVYASMFHCARALLFKDGIKERSHYAVYIYLKEKYSKHISSEILSSFSAYRLQRHELLYGFSEDLEPTSKNEVDDALKVATEFISTVKKLLV